METPLDRIAANIAHHAGVICDYQAQSQQTIGIGLFPANTPEGINRARQDLLQASAELQQICSEPGEYLEQTQIYVSPEIPSCVFFFLSFLFLWVCPRDWYVPFRASTSGFRLYNGWSTSTSYNTFH
jgi:hypothetical protein